MKIDTKALMASLGVPSNALSSDTTSSSSQMSMAAQKHSLYQQALPATFLDLLAEGVCEDTPYSVYLIDSTPTPGYEISLTKGTTQIEINLFDLPHPDSIGGTVLDDHNTCVNQRPKHGFESYTTFGALAAPLQNAAHAAFEDIKAHWFFYGR